MTGKAGHKWRLIQEAPDIAVYRRALGNLELAFYWDWVFSGTATTISEVEIVADPDLENELFSEQNVQRAWIRTKQRYPLLGATVEELADSETVEFVLKEENLRTYRPGEINQSQVKDVEGFMKIRKTILAGPAPVSSDILGRVWITKQRHIPFRYHMIFCIMHCISDGKAGTTVTREFLHELSSLSNGIRVAGLDLAERLSMLVPVEDLNPIPAMSAARRKWREAAAKVIGSLREARKMGGHSLPGRLLQDLGRPGHSHKLTLRLPEDISRQIIDYCRTLGITLGSTLPVLSQVALSRVLYRRRHQTDEKGESLLGDDEWDHRRIQPMHFSGPINLRPYLNREWFNGGGANDVCAGVGFIHSTLPFMPTAKEPRRGERAPSFSDLLSPERFVYRARLVHSQIQRQLRSPLLHELHNVGVSRRLALSKAAGLAWRARTAGMTDKFPDTRNCGSYIITNDGSSFGTRESTLPSEYPIRGNDTRTRLYLADSGVHLRVRPSEIYISAITDRKQLEFFCLFDLNSYDEDLVREWLENIRYAATHYLGSEATQKFRL